MRRRLLKRVEVKSIYLVDRVEGGLADEGILSRRLGRIEPLHEEAGSLRAEAGQSTVGISTRLNKDTQERLNVPIVEAASVLLSGDVLPVLLQVVGRRLRHNLVASIVLRQLGKCRHQSQMNRCHVGSEGAGRE